MFLVENARDSFRSAVNFSGRSSRKQFWLFVLFVLIGFVLCTIANSMLFGAEIEHVVKVSRNSDGLVSQTPVARKSYNGGWLAIIFGLICLLPLAALGARRLQDTGKSKWWGLPLLLMPNAAAWLLLTNTIDVPINPQILADNPGIPATVAVPSVSASAILATWVFGVACYLLLIVFLSKASQPGPNKYGPNLNEVPS